MSKTPATRCLLLCKDKNFKANHNVFILLIKQILDVCYYAKIRILKQITTVNFNSVKSKMMFVIMQR